MNTTELYEILERLGNLVRTGTKAAGADYGLQPVHWQVLHYLARCNRYSDMPQSVTEYLGSTKGTVSQTIKVLEKNGLIKKQIDVNDKRVIHLKITAKGRRWLNDVVPDPALNIAMQKLSVASRKRLGVELTELLRVIQDANELQSFGTCKTCRYNIKHKDGIQCGLTGEALSEQDIRLICREHEYES